MTKRKQGGKGDMKCFFKFLFIYFLAAPALRCCHRLSLAVARGGYSLVAVPRLLIAVVSLVSEHQL